MGWYGRIALLKNSRAVFWLLTHIQYMGYYPEGGEK